MDEVHVLPGGSTDGEGPAPRERVITLGVITRLDLPVERVLDSAKSAGLEGVVILGFGTDGSEYFASTYADGGTVIWLLERAKRALFVAADDADPC